MSLFDAFLDEGLVNPPAYPGSLRREVHIAIRNNGVMGSGTPDDPYNGSNKIAGKRTKH